MDVTFSGRALNPEGHTTVPGLWVIHGAHLSLPQYGLRGQQHGNPAPHRHMGNVVYKVANVQRFKTCEKSLSQLALRKVYSLAVRLWVVFIR